MAADELGGSGGGVDEDLAFGVGAGELCGRGGGGDGDREEEVGVAGDVVDDAGDDVGGVVEEHDGLAVDAGDAELVGGDASDDGDVFGSLLVPVVVEAAGRKGGECGA